MRAAGIHAITSGISALNSRAAFTRPWKEMIAAQVVLAHRLGEPDLPGQRAGIGDLLAVAGDELARARRRCGTSRRPRPTTTTW